MARVLRDEATRAMAKSLKTASQEKSASREMRVARREPGRTQMKLYGIKLSSAAGTLYQESRRPPTVCQKHWRAGSSTRHPPRSVHSTVEAAAMARTRHQLKPSESWSQGWECPVCRAGVAEEQEHTGLVLLPLLSKNLGELPQLCEVRREPQ